jgi:hypothetical protein
MKATEAVDDIENWLEFLKKEQPYDEEGRPVLIASGEKHLAQLVGGAEPTDP